MFTWLFQALKLAAKHTFGRETTQVHGRMKFKLQNKYKILR